MDAEKATQPGAPQLHENAPNNVVFEWHVGDQDGTDAAFADAEVVVRQRLVNQRLIPNPMEVRGDIGLLQPGHGRVHGLDVQPDAAHPAAAAHRVRDWASRSTRCAASAPTSAAPSAPRSSATPTWRSSCSPARRSAGARSSGSRARRESYRLHDPRPRPHHVRRGRRATRDGEVTGLRVKTFANLGGRLSTIGPGIPTTLYGRVLSGPYKIPNVSCEVTGVYTNTTFVDAYRGAGRPEATYVVERAMDLFADELGIDRGRDPAPELPAARLLPVRQPVAGS